MFCSKKFNAESQSLMKLQQFLSWNYNIVVKSSVIIAPKFIRLAEFVIPLANYQSISSSGGINFLIWTAKTIKIH